MASLTSKFRLPAWAWPAYGLSTRLVFRRLRRGVLALSLALVLLLGGFSEFNPSAIDLAVAPYRYSILGWELGHLLDKWFRKLRQALPGGPELSREERLARVREFFLAGQELARLERELLLPGTARGHQASTVQEELSVQEEMGLLEQRLHSRQAVAEETIESEVAAVLDQAGLGTGIGLFPPVDAVYSSSPHILVVSPRDRIVRQEDVLLKPGLSIAEKEEIEERIFREENLSALVEDTGGVAVYPSVVLDSAGLHHAVVITTHEWLHQWLLFRPLGRAFWSNPEMTSLNETVATVAGEELGDQVFTAITGEVVYRTPTLQTSPDPEAFDFRAEMRETRLRAEELLAQSRIEEAEAYMEERRQLFVAHGYPIRKLNQAYFAFHGTYATSPASISPIGDQVRALRNHSGSVGDFLHTVAQFSTYQEFVDYLEELRPGEE